MPAPPVPAIEFEQLTFGYGAAQPVVFGGLSLSIAAGTRCLLLGANGVGKSTLLRIAAGKHMLPAANARVFGRSAFHDTTLAAEVAFIGGPFPFAADIAVKEILERRRGVEPARRAAVLDLLDIDPGWRMNRVSDGQRRRVQLLLDLERRLRLILLDEVTAELDVLARADLLRFLRAESERDGVTIVYASHVLEGLQQFGTDLLFLSPGRLRCLSPLTAVPELVAPQQSPGAVSPLHQLCERWMREDRGAGRGGQGGGGGGGDGGWGGDHAP
ncbi:MAG: ATP-binding cassette domain-containing protein [Polyangia bacterium]